MANFLKTSHYVQQLKDKHKHMTFGFSGFCAQQATCRISHATGKVNFFQVFIRAAKNTAVSPSSRRGDKILKQRNNFILMFLFTAVQRY
jgi:hypothetical protein